MMGGDGFRHESFEAARRRGEWTITELWVQYLAAGGGLDLFSIEAFLHGVAPIPVSQQDILANALNERLGDVYQAARLSYLGTTGDTEFRRQNAVAIINDLLNHNPPHAWGGPMVDSPAGRLAWLEALVDVSQQLLSLGRGVAPVVQGIIEHVRRLSQARTVTFVGPSSVDEAHFEVRLATGAGASNLIRKSYDKSSTLEGRAMQENRGFLSTAQDSYSHHLDAGAEEPAGPLLAVAFDGPEDEQGAIIASRTQGEAQFSEAELAMAQDFARQCGIALRLIDGQASREQLRFLEQQEIETQLLHDDLIQRLFGLGMTLESGRNSLRETVDTAPQAQGHDLWQQASSQIDAIISRLRSTLTTTRQPDSYA